MNRVPRLGLVAAVLGAFLLCGCDGQEPTPTPSPSASPSSEQSSEPSESPSPTEQEAGGKAMVMDNVLARAPKGWTVLEDEGFGLMTAREPEAFAQVTLSDFGTTTASTAREFLRVRGTEGFLGATRVSFDAELDGEPAYRAVGRGSLGRRVEYGAVRDGLGAALIFSFTEFVPARQRERIVQSVVASFRWR